MGNALRLGISKLGLSWNKWRASKRARNRTLAILILGLQAAGKTTIAYRLQNPQEDFQENGYIQTKGFNNYHVKVANKTMVHLYELGGHESIRELWQHYYADAHGIIFVLDSSKPEDLPLAGRILSEVLNDKRVRGKPVLLLANKQDLNDLTETEIAKVMNLQQLVNSVRCLTRLDLCSAVDPMRDFSIFDGFNWLVSYINVNYARLHERITEDIFQEKHSIKLEPKPKRTKKNSVDVDKFPTGRKNSLRINEHGRQSISKAASVSSIHCDGNGLDYSPGDIDPFSSQNTILTTLNIEDETTLISKKHHNSEGDVINELQSSETNPEINDAGMTEVDSKFPNTKRLSPEGADSDDASMPPLSIQKRRESNSTIIYSTPKSVSSEIQKPGEILMVTTLAQVHDDNVSTDTSFSIDSVARGSVNALTARFSAMKPGTGKSEP